LARALTVREKIMSIRMRKTIGDAVVFVVAVSAMSLGACSKKDAAQPSDAAVDAPPGECEQMQRAYVNGVLAADQQSDVATTVGAVLRTTNFHRTMPYCSGDRPSEPSAGSGVRTPPRTTR
jgi:hypothetical protein